MDASVINRLVLLMALGLAACGPEPTPFAVLPVPSATPITELPPTPGNESTATAPIRYGMLANTADFAPVSDLQSDNVALETDVDPTNAANYDIVVGYGLWEGWTQSPVLQHVVLIINTDLPPLDDETVAGAVRGAVNAADILATLTIPGALPGPATTGAAPRDLRETLANAGRPDGFALGAAVPAVPGTERLLTQFRQAGFEVGVMNTAAETHLRVAVWTDTDQRDGWLDTYGEQNVLDLYSLPISYQTNTDLQVAFTDDGWPLVAR